MKVLTYEKVTKVEGHECSLPQEEELINLYVNGGIFVDFRRKFRQFMMVSASNQETKSVLKSSAQIRSEESRHLRNHYFMIHPLSDGRVTWEKLMIMVYVGHFLLMPLELALPVSRQLVLRTKFLCDILSLIDIVLFFLTGYYSPETRRVVMSANKVWKHYIFTYFIFDLLGSLSYNWYITLTGHHHLNWLKFMMVFRLVRLPTLDNYIKKFCLGLDLWSYKLTTINLLIWLIILIWWGTAATFQVYSFIHNLKREEFLENMDVFTPMLDCCFQVVRSMTLVGISEIKAEVVSSMLLNIVLLCGGSILNMVILSHVIQVYRRHSNSADKYNNLIQEIGEYMTYKELPSSLRNKVLRYVEFKFQKNIFKEGDILLSKILKQDVVLHNCKRMVERVDFFKGLPNNLILRIVTKLRSEIYLPNDMIVQAGVPGNAMYFIYMGTVAIYTVTDKEICHLEDGSHFGEISLVINEPRVASVIAVTDCEVFRLSRKDFLEAIEPYPSLWNKIKNSALSRLKDTKKVMENPSLLALARQRTDFP